MHGSATTSPIPDHCTSFALSDPKEKSLDDECEHSHDKCCLQCEKLKTAINDVGPLLRSTQLSEEEWDDLLYAYEQAVLAINAWKAHQLRTIQQDKACLDCLKEMDETTALITQDWAMKFLPQKYCETQADWFPKCGISWHISIVLRKHGDQMQHQAFVHIVTNTRQGFVVVIEIIHHILKELKKENQEISLAFVRQDNAGCYHNATILAGCHLMKELTGIKVERVDFTDPQGSKAPCDRKAASLKAHIRRYITEGHDVLTAEDLKCAMLSNGGLNGVRVAFIEAKDLHTTSTQDPKWDGISSLNNFHYHDDAKKVTTWKSYNIGKGKIFEWSKIPIGMSTFTTNSSIT